MARNIRFYKSNAWDSGVVSYSSQQTAFPATNTQHRWFLRPWRTQTGYVSNQWLKCYSATKTPWQAIIIHNHNLQAGATLKLQASDDNFASTPVDITIPITSGLIVYVHPSTIGRYYTRLLVNDTSNPSGYLEIGRVWLSEVFSPSYDYSPNWEILPVDPSVVSESEHGQVATIQRTQYQEQAFEIMGVPSADIIQFEAMISAFGTFKAFYLTIKPSDSNPHLRTFYVQALEWVWNPMAPGWRALNIRLKTER